MANMRSIALTFADLLAARGFRPLLRTNEQRVIGGPGSPLWAAATIADNAATSVDLRNANVWDRRVQRSYGDSAAPIEGVLHLEGFNLYVNDADWQAESNGLKEALDNGLYLLVQTNNSINEYPLRGRIVEAWEQTQYTLATAADGQRNIFRNNGPYMLEAPVRVNLKSDTFALRCDTAINWSSGPIATYLQVFGAIAPLTLPGTGTNHLNAASAAQVDDGGAYATANPLQMGQITTSFFSRMLRR